MHWEAVVAIAAVVQTALIASAAAVALVQIRHLRDQNELAAFIQLFATYNSPDARRARHFVTNELAERLRDPRYLREIVEGRLNDHPEGLVLNYFNQVGHLMMTGVVKSKRLLHEHVGVAPMMWKYLLPVIALRRTAFPEFMTSFEWFVIHCDTLDSAAASARLRKQTPPGLWSKLDVHHREIEETQTQMLQRLQPTDGSTSISSGDSS